MRLEFRFYRGFVANGKCVLHEIDHRTPTYNVKLDGFVPIGHLLQVGENHFTVDSAET